MDGTSQIRGVRELDTKPIYNIKAVAEATGLPPTTLRAWERRYGALAPSRTGSGYRLYSERDIAVLRWLKARVDEGLNISQAIALLAHEQARTSAVASEPRSERLRGLGKTREALAAALLEFDEARADEILEEAFAAFGVEEVLERVVGPALIQVGEKWHRGQVSVAGEHFASNYLRRKLESIINASPRRDEGPLLMLACAPDDWHELGLLLVYLFLRRRGYNVLYLGQNVPVAHFIREIRRLRPALVMVSATTRESVPGLIELARAIEGLDAPRPEFGYGGAIFNAEPSLRAEVPGIFLGETARAAVDNVGKVLAAAGRPVALDRPALSRRSSRRAGGQG